MKKKVFLAFILLLGIFTLTGCVNKKTLTVDEVKTKMEKLGYDVTDNKNKYSDQEYVVNALLIGNSNFTVDFLEISDIELAKELFESNKERMDGNRNGNYTNKSLSGNNYESYELVSDGYYMYICRIDNTILYADNKVEFEKEMKQIIKELNY